MAPRTKTAAPAEEAQKDSLLQAVSARVRNNPNLTYNSEVHRSVLAEKALDELNITRDSKVFPLAAVVLYNVSAKSSVDPSAVIKTLKANDHGLAAIKSLEIALESYKKGRSDLTPLDLREKLDKLPRIISIMKTFYTAEEERDNPGARAILEKLGKPVY